MKAQNITPGAISSTSIFGIKEKIASVLLAISLLPAAIMAQVPVQNVQILKYTDHEPLGNMRTRFLNDVLFPTIEKESSGRLKIETHWNAEVCTGYDALRVISTGTAADLGIVVPEYAANDLPLHQLFKSFICGPSGDKQVAFFQRAFSEIPNFSTELDKKNVVRIAFATGYPVAFFSTKPLTTLDDIIGGTWRSASFWHQDYLKKHWSQTRDDAMGRTNLQCVATRRNQRTHGEY